MVEGVAATARDRGWRRVRVAAMMRARFPAIDTPDAMHATATRPAADTGAVHARIALAAIAAFVLAGIVLHARRDDLGVVDAQMSRYLIGDWGHLLQAAYVSLALGMVVLAAGLRRALVPAARSAAPGLLFVAGGISLSVTAYAWMDLPGVDDSLEGFVHGITAQAAFLCAPTAMVLQSLGFRRDPAWRATARWALPLALACFAAVWVLALWREAPRGLAQKAVIALILAWLVAVALSLLRRARAGGGLC